MDRVKVACAGMGRRSRAHLPVLKAMEKELELVAVCDVVEDQAKASGEQYGVPYYTDIAEMLERERPHVLDLTTPALVHHVGVKVAAERGVHVLTEVPMSYTVPCLDFMIRTAREAGIHLEACENYFRWPLERLKRLLIDAGIFGDIYRATIDGSLGHKGHEFAMGRHYLGFEKKPTGAIASIQKDPVDGRREMWMIGSCDFVGGSQCNVELHTYRPHLPRGAVQPDRNFFGTKGFSYNHKLAYIPADSEETVPIEMEWVLKNVGGVETPDRLVAKVDPEVVWENPFSDCSLGAGNWDRFDAIAIAYEYRSIARAALGEAEVEYGPENSMTDTVLRLAMLESARRGGERMALPLAELTQEEEQIHRQFEERFGHHPLDL